MTKLVNILNELIEVCEDGLHGYQTASHGVSSSDLKMLFNEYSLERQGFITQLKSKVESLGDIPQDSGSIKSTLHRAWINIKSVVTGGDELAILNECVNGDKIAVETYEKNLKEELPADIREMIQDQLSKIRSAFNRVSQLDHIKK